MIRIALALLLVLAACRPETRTEETSTSVVPPVPATTPSDTPAPVRTDRSTYVLRPAGEATIVTTLRAPADQTLYIMNCNGASGASLQRKVGEEWVYAWSVAMNACLSPPIVVPPGEEHIATIGLREDAANVAYPAGGVLESGTYRVVWSGVLTSFDPDVRPFGPELSLEERVSAPFRIDVAR